MGSLFLVEDRRRWGRGILDILYPIGPDICLAHLVQLLDDGEDEDGGD